MQFTLLQSFTPDDLITITASGVVDFRAGGGADENAAGISLEPAFVGTSNQVTDVASGRSLEAGALAIWNNSLGAFNLFPVDASTGLGSSSPPTNLSVTRRIGDVFSTSGFSGLSAGEEFRLLNVDVNSGNSGSFTVSLSFQSVPEPSSLSIFAAMLTFCATRRKRSARR
ncbi:MAG: PEP-CTERM sorting domain-containing protein [Planctomycetota bacterium]